MIFLSKIKCLFLSVFTNKILEGETLRIVDIKKNSLNEHVAIIQVIGKNTVFKKEVKNIVNDNIELKEFSHTDVRSICYYTFLDLFAPKFKIAKNNLGSGKPYFEILKKGKKAKIKMNPVEVFNDKKILCSLSPEDAYIVGYMTKEEENRQFCKNKKKEQDN